MGVIKRGILGGFSGRIANVIGGSWKGIAYIRSMPLSVANPNTAGQQAQRGKFSQCIIIAKFLLAEIIKPLNDRFAQAMSGYNRFMIMSIDAFDASGLATPGNFKISEGSLTAVGAANIVVSDAVATVEATWTDNSGSGSAVALDKVYLVAHNVDNDEWALNVGAVVRGDETSTATMPSNNNTADVIHIWLAFRRADGTLVSNTVHEDTVV
jgi:hypothetical protein